MSRQDGDRTLGLVPRAWFACSYLDEVMARELFRRLLRFVGEPDLRRQLEAFAEDEDDHLELLHRIADELGGRLPLLVDSIRGIGQFLGLLMGDAVGIRGQLAMVRELAGIERRIMRSLDRLAAGLQLDAPQRERLAVIWLDEARHHHWLISHRTEVPEGEVALATEYPTMPRETFERWASPRGYVRMLPPGLHVRPRRLVFREGTRFHVGGLLQVTLTAWLPPSEVRFDLDLAGLASGHHALCFEPLPDGTRVVETVRLRWSGRDLPQAWRFLLFGWLSVRHALAGRSLLRSPALALPPTLTWAAGRR